MAMFSTLEETVTEKKLDLLTKEWQRFSVEPIEVNVTGNDVFAFGSEIACLRLFYHFRHSQANCKVAKSLNLNTWYFVKYKHAL
jgi:hypothetical protein